MDTPYRIDTTSLLFRGLVIDAAPQLLEESYRLRYQVYCLERHFLPAEDYPDGLEIDKYDPQSVHLAVLNSVGDLAAAARLVQLTEAGLPLLDHCSIFAHETSLDAPGRRVVEISRLVSQKSAPRSADVAGHARPGAVGRPDSDERRRGGQLVLALYKAIYETSKRRGFTHWLAASETSLQRVLARIGFPFRAIGPAGDYHGKVAPYLLDLMDLDKIILGRLKPMLRDYLDELEPRFRPVDDAACTPSDPR